MNENENNVVEIETGKPVENQEANTPEQETAPEVKHTIFGKIDAKILARREAKAKKKAEKKPMDKGKKAAIIGGGVALGLGILGAVGKAALNAAEKYAGESEVDNAQDDGYPTEDIPEEPTEVEVETETAENEET